MTCIVVDDTYITTLERMTYLLQYLIKKILKIININQSASQASIAADGSTHVVMSSALHLLNTVVIGDINCPISTVALHIYIYQSMLSCAMQ